MAMKLIFLDVDGVLNSAEWLETNQGEIDPAKVRLLKQMIDATGAKVVLSSTWRNIDGSDGNPRHPMYDYLVGELRACGIEIFSRTPLLYNNRPKGDYAKYGISDCLIQTRYWGTHGGLQQGHVEQAIQVLTERTN